MNPSHSLGLDEVRSRLALVAAPGIGAVRVLELLREHESGTAALAALQRTYPAQAAATRLPEVLGRVHRTLRVVAENDVEIIWFDDTRYPELLQQRLDRHAPVLLFTRGDVGLLAAASIAVVGCRQASNYGLDVAEQIGTAIGRVGGCVVSGLARGIDAAAQRAALEAGGTTIGVLGCGIDVYYPRENTALQDRTAAAGLLLSEQLPGEPPMKHHFPHRNRIIAALSQAVVVVEAGEKSGAVRTAEHAISQDVDVYVVPNAIDHPNMQGNLALIRDGAHVYTGARDLLESVRMIGVGQALPDEADGGAPPADMVHCQIWEQLSADARHVDAVAAAAGFPTTRTLVALLELELEGRVQQYPGGRFARIRRRPLERM